VSFTFFRRAVVAITLIACGCEGDAELRWDVRFADPMDGADVVAFEATITEGGCTGTEVYALQFRRSGFDEGVEVPPTLGPGTYGFTVAALDDQCRVVAFGCEGADLPDADGVVEVVLARAGGEAACAPSLCMSGICEAGDGGVEDCPTGFSNCNVDPGDGCEVDVRSDLDNCGACDSPCQVPHATPTCSAGVCVVASCDDDWSDCDGDPSNGCETSLLTLSDCGACRGAGEGPRCALDHATSSCESGACVLLECHDGWDDCDGMLGNGCETPLDEATDCGGCGNTCPTGSPNCVLVGGTGACTATCPPTAPTLCGTTCVATATDPRHCGGCAAPCTLDNASATCTAGTCTVQTCNPGWASCDGSGASGCETSTTSLSNCGACGTRCDAADASMECHTGVCEIDECFGPRGDCNEDVADGCEADLASATTCGSCEESCMAPSALCAADTGAATCVADCPSPLSSCGDRCLDARFDDDNCGGCGVSCELPEASERCYFGACEIVECQEGYGDCDGNVANGCENALDDDEDNCGACDNVCSAGVGSAASCSGGVCGSDCEAGLADCNGDPEDGCETPIDTLTNCGRCGNACSIPNATTACTSGSCVVASCNSGFEDCNGSTFDGCEVNTASDADNCGGCRTGSGNRCTGQDRMCCMGVCAQTCG